MRGFELSHRDGRDHLNATLVCDEVETRIQSEGGGVVESFVSGLSEFLQHELVLVDYSEHAVTHSASSDAVCYVQMNIEGKRYCGVGLSSDIVDATLQAILCAVNGFLPSDYRAAEAVANSAIA